MFSPSRVRDDYRLRHRRLEFAEGRKNGAEGAGPLGSVIHIAPKLGGQAMSIADAFRRRPVATLLATGLGVGLIPVAPGTFGSVEGIALAVSAGLLLRRRGFLPGESAVIEGIAVLFVLALAVWVAGRAEEAAGVRDPGAIVVDEVVGQWIAVLPVPLVADPRLQLGLWGFGFLLFRFLDIVKPGPIRRLQELPGGWGVVLDDVLAGLVTAVAVAGAVVALPSL
jgi:phosphatidylglycerophosphatase A